MDRFTPDKLKERLRTGISNLKTQQHGLGFSKRGSIPGSPLGVTTWQGAARELTFSPKELQAPAIVRARDPGKDRAALPSLLRCVIAPSAL